jgi:hypothetical protein
MDILTDTNYDFNVWYNTYDPNFIDICAKSKVPEKWVSYDRVLSSKYKDSIIKPVNSYAENLYPFPELINITKDTITLRQHNHAEILLIEEAGKLKALDRPWIRQFYQSSHNHEPSTGCFDDAFVFYVPWFIDEDVDVAFCSSPESPIMIYSKKHSCIDVPSNTKFVDPVMVPFRFKRFGAHMESETVGKIKKKTPIFDMTVKADDIIIERVRKFYEENN